MIPPEGVDVLTQQGRREAQHFVWKIVPIGPQPGHHALDLDHVPGHHRVMQQGQGTETLCLIPELPAPQRALLSEIQEPGQVIRRLSLVQVPRLDAAKLFAPGGAQDVHGLLGPTDLGECLVHSVLAGIGSRSVQDQRGFLARKFYSECDTGGAVPGSIQGGGSMAAIHTWDTRLRAKTARR